MRRVGNTHKAVLAAALVLGGLGAVLCRSNSREPEYAGRTLHSWLAKAEEVWLRGSALTKDPVQDEVASAVRKIGTNALPELIRLLESRDGAISRGLAAWGHACPELPFHPAGAEQKHIRALLGFKFLGPVAGPAVPKLIALLQSSEEETALLAARALARIGPAATNAVPSLIKNLSDPDLSVRLAATNALRRIAPLAALNAGTRMG